MGDEAQGVADARHGLHPPCWPVSRQARHLLEAAQERPHAGDRPARDQRRAAAPREPGLRHSTKTKVSLTGIKTDAVTAAFFARENGDKEASEKTVSAERKKAQQEIDSSIVKALNADAVMAKYLKARFSLTSGMKPHEMVF